MTTVYAVASAKGGVGKTTTTANLAALLADAGKDVVAIDADVGMANLASSLGVDVTGDSLHDVLAGRASPTDAVHVGPVGLRVVPGEIDIEAYADADPAGIPEVVEAFDDADYVFVDCGAGLTHDAALPLAFADETLLVSTPERDALRDTEKTRELAERLGGHVTGAAITRSTDDADADLVDDLLDARVLEWIPEDAAVAGALRAGEPLVTFAPGSPSADAYRSLATTLTGVTFEAPKAAGTGDADPAAGTGDSEETEDTEAEEAKEAEEVEEPEEAEKAVEVDGADEADERAETEDAEDTAEADDAEEEAVSEEDDADDAEDDADDAEDDADDAEDDADDAEDDADDAEDDADDAEDDADGAEDDADDAEDDAAESNGSPIAEAEPERESGSADAEADGTAPDDAAADAEPTVPENEQIDEELDGSIPFRDGDPDVHDSDVDDSDADDTDADDSDADDSDVSDPEVAIADAESEESEPATDTEADDGEGKEKKKKGFFSRLLGR